VGWKSHSFTSLTSGQFRVTTRRIFKEKGRVVVVQEVYLKWVETLISLHPGDLLSQVGRALLKPFSGGEWIST